ncbi:MAG: hypothetical protein OSA39_05665, partial [Sphingobium sp.]|nr:hypothetical protein [Sphingobium sp.]
MDQGYRKKKEHMHGDIAIEQARFGCIMANAEEDQRHQQTRRGARDSLAGDQAPQWHYQISEEHQEK